MLKTVQPLDAEVLPPRRDPGKDEREDRRGHPRFGPRGLEISDDTTIEQWRDDGATLSRIGKGLQWAMGDWIEFGEKKKWSHKYDEAIKILGLKLATCKNLAWVSRAFETSSREDVLSFKHHMVVVAKDIQPFDRSRFLALAIKHKWSVAELRKQIRIWRLGKLLSVRNTADGLGRVHIVKADALEFLAAIEPYSVDLLLTDPPYATDLDDVDAFAAAWLPPAMAILKHTGRAYIFTGAYPEELVAYARHLLLLAVDSGWTLDYPLVWTYRNTLGPSPAQAYKMNWQACWHLYGPHAPPLNCPEMVEQFTVQDISAPDGRTGVRFHAWQKPDEIAERLILHSTEQRALVVDPFCGTGTFAAAAARLNRDIDACDTSDEMLSFCTQRGLDVDGR